MRKLWHDDARPAPDGWIWAKTNAEAMELLSAGDIDEISMDHDLGAILTGSSLDLFLKGESKEECGLDLARWMCQEEILPETIWIHSWNPAGAERMARCFQDHGHKPIIQPFSTLNYESYPALDID